MGEITRAVRRHGDRYQCHLPLAWSTFEALHPGRRDYYRMRYFRTITNKYGMEFIKFMHNHIK